MEESTAFVGVALKAGGKMFACVPTNKSAEPDSLLVRVDMERRAEMLEADPGLITFRRIMRTILGAGAIVAGET